MRIRYILLMYVAVLVGFIVFICGFLNRELLISAFLFLAVFILISELFARTIFKMNFRILEDMRWRMQPHPFCHFVPRDTDDVRDGFREVEHLASRFEGGKKIYLAGDCSVFEEHLPVQETMAYQLSALMENASIYNAGAPHYTSLHSYHRFINDLMKLEHKMDTVIFFNAANDVLSFVHNHYGAVAKDYTHVYKPWMVEQFSERFKKCPLYIVKLLTALIMFGKERLSWETIAFQYRKDFYTEDNIRTAKELFNSEAFMQGLKLFATTCQAYGIEFILTTFFFNKADAVNESRIMYMEGIMELNQFARDFAKDNGIPLIDLAQSLKQLESGTDIENKWHYTKSGNAVRAQIIADALTARKAVKQELKG